MRWVRLAGLAAVAALISIRWPAHLTRDGWAVCWLLLPAILVGLHATVGRAVLLAFAFGLLTDLLSLEPLGLHAFLYGVAALVVVRVREHLFADHFATQGLLAFGLALGVNLALLLRLEIAQPDLALGARVPTLLLLSLMTGALFPILVAVDRRIGLLNGFRAEERRV